MSDSCDLVCKSYNKICDMIFRYEISPGNPVSDFVLSKKLGISRTPIRQAIMQLEAKGLVEKRENGYYVVSINENFIRELYEARSCFELSAVLIIIKNNLPVNDLLIYCEKEEECLKNGEYIKALELDSEFHHQLIVKTNNELLINSYDIIQNRMKLINLLALVSLNHETPDVYKQIIKSFENKDVRQTWSLLENQNNKGKAQKIEALKKFGGLGQENLFNFITGCFVAFKK